MPTVVRTESSAARNSSALTMSSPRRRRATPRTEVPGGRDTCVLAVSTSLGVVDLPPPMAPATSSSILSLLLPACSSVSGTI